MNDFFSFLKNKSRVILVILFLMIASVFVYFIIGEFYRAYINREINKTQEELKKIEEEIERAKKFDEEKYAEKITSILEPESYFSTSTDIELEGVEIIPKRDRKLVINHVEGYQLEIPKDLILNQTKSTKALNFDSLTIIQQLGFDVALWQWSRLKIFVWDLNDPEDKKFIEESRLFERIATTVEEKFVPRWSTETTTDLTIPEEIYINNEKAYKITHFYKEDGQLKKFPFLNTSFVFIKANKIYEIHLGSSDYELIELIESTFKIY